MSGWSRHIDDLASATAELLARGAPPASRLLDAHAALAARDAVLVEVRQLVGSVGQAPRFVPVRELTLSDVVHRPAIALHQALSELPRALPFGAVELPAVLDEALPQYERLWQQAARAAVGLERYVDAVAHLPGEPAWDVLRDLTDIACALPYLDRDLSQTLRRTGPGVTELLRAQDHLVHDGHAKLRMTGAELRTRLAVREHSSAASSAGSGRPRPPDGATTLSTTPPTSAPDAARTGTPVARPPQPLGSDSSSGSLAEAMTRYVHSVSARGTQLSVPDLRAVARLLEIGSSHAAQVLERIGSAAPSVGPVLTGLRDINGLARQLRDAPVRSMTGAHLELLRDSTVLRAELSGLVEQLPRNASAAQLRRLALPALAFAQEVPALSQALDRSLREAVASSLMLVPGVLDARVSTSATWITARMDEQRTEPPEALARSGQLVDVARRLAHPVRTAHQELARDLQPESSAAGRALLDARRHVGAARADLRKVLAGRAAALPMPGGAALPAHPRLTSSARTITAPR